ncbi:hypothetical protein DRJ16_01275 [Candidatus Woesearchaeota archaeon]|nr:MAG: hypothetical protein DRJ16_01275 [Candidatus Woesearchaeota archaeon]
MNILVAALIVTLINSSFGFVGLFSLFVSKRKLDAIASSLIALSAGTLLGGGLFHLLKESFIPSMAVLGFLTFFLLEEVLHWHRCRICSIHPYSYLILIGDAIHNFIDGVVIIASFLVGFKLGLISSFLILLHEFPQELGIFGVLIKGGFERKKAMICAFLVQTTSILGVIVGSLFINTVKYISAYIIPFAAGGFIYIAASDLIPAMHREKGIQKLKSILWMVVGILLLAFI